MRGAALRPMHLPRVHQRTLGNGLLVQVAQVRAVPLFCARLLVRGGSEGDPKGREGLADFAAQLYRRGTRKRSAQALDEAIEHVGGTLAISAGLDTLAFRVSAPSAHFAPLLKLLAEVVREPRFDPKEVQSTRARMLAELENDRDEPGLIADKAMVRHLWGAHPYANDGGGTLTSVARLGRDDVLALHQERVGPRVALLHVVGDVEPPKVFSAAQRAWGGWGGGPAAYGAVPVPGAAPGAGKLLVIDDPKLTQSHVRMAWRSIPRMHPDSVPLFLVNHALGGSFTSRLVRAVRVDRGLTYGIDSYLEWRREASTHEVSTSTRTAHTRQVLDVVLAEMERLKRSGPKEAELTAAQRFIVGLYPTSVERNEGLAAKLGDVWNYSLGDEWIARYRERVARVAPAQARAAARERLLPHPAAIVIVGDAAKVAPRLSALGPVRVVPLAEFE